ncbi:MAG TPA: family 1 glycosylhydrolase [Rhizomicrobium sp.]|jgi:beta-glucosidase|nr:family 1 glycosylhydrolase [Rhizomicrobium sp.]
MQQGALRGEALEFPKDFLWGTATAAHQVEGGNTASDLWLMEMAPDSFFAEPSGDACDHYHLYPHDLALLKGLGFGAYRFSVEWARIEPEEGFYSHAALDHYRRMIAACRALDIVPIVTFHHFTAPLWFTRDGGWTHPKSADRFARYCEKAGRALGDLMAFACTINEANIPLMISGWRVANEGGWETPQRFAEIARRCGGDPARWAPYLICDGYGATPNLIAAHRKAYEALKSAGLACPIGITLALHDLQAQPGGEMLRDAAEQLIEGQFLESVRGDDFVGVQTYTRIRFGPKGHVPPAADTERTQMGYEFYPEALEATVRKAARISGCPVLVTENGIGIEDDTRRIAYAKRALEGLHAAIVDGVDIRGYIHWSLLDNYEWLEGYRPKFGLVAVDRTTQARKPKPSAYWLGAIAKNNALG